MLINNQTGINLLGLSDRLKITTHSNSDRNTLLPCDRRPWRVC
ncbi:hypothetical protein [Microcoleus sp. CAWBG640]